MTETADIVTTAERGAEIIMKTRPKPRNKIGDQGSRVTMLEHTARLKSNSTDHARYTDSEMNAENSDQDTPSEIADASSSCPRKKADP